MFLFHLPVDAIATVGLRVFFLLSLIRLFARHPSVKFAGGKSEASVGTISTWLFARHPPAAEAARGKSEAPKFA